MRDLDTTNLIAMDRTTVHVPLALKETKYTAANESGTVEAAASFFFRLLLPKKKNIDLVSKENSLWRAKNCGGTYSLRQFLTAQKTHTINARI